MAIRFSKASVLRNGQTASDGIRLDARIVGAVVPVGLTGTQLTLEVQNPSSGAWMTVHGDDVDAGGKMGVYDFAAATKPFVTAIRGAALNGIGFVTPVPTDATIRFVSDVAQVGDVSIITIVEE